MKTDLFKLSFHLFNFAVQEQKLLFHAILGFRMWFGSLRNSWFNEEMLEWAAHIKINDLEFEIQFKNKKKDIDHKIDYLSLLFGVFPACVHWKVKKQSCVWWQVEIVYQFITFLNTRSPHLQCAVICSFHPTQWQSHRCPPKMNATHVHIYSFGQLVRGSNIHVFTPCCLSRLFISPVCQLRSWGEMRSEVSKEQTVWIRKASTGR